MTPQRILIIGGNSGIGAHLKDSLSKGHRKYSPFPSVLDVRSEESILKYFSICPGPFDQIVYCAGVNRLQWIKDFTYQEMVDIFSVNLFGFLALVAEHEKRWPEAEGSITAIVSDSYRIPMRGSLLYGTSKTALAGAIKNMARELAPRWRVNGVAPGQVEDTPMTEYIDETVPTFRGWSPEFARKYADSGVPMGRRITKQEVSQVCMNTMFGPQSQTGSIIEITGGK